jgi:MFS-type transporter involved in bile tolerance (Atg22 family)
LPIESAIADWSNFMVAGAGAAAALAGLLFVAISINLQRIVDLPGVAGRAGETIITLGATLAVTLATLIPHPRNKPLLILQARTGALLILSISADQISSAGR